MKYSSKVFRILLANFKHVQEQVKVKVTLKLTDGQSEGLSWYRAPSGAHDQIFIYLFLKVAIL
jgi:hypothetical protein